MKESLFRKKSLEQISSPENLTEYLRITKPSVWIILSAMITILVTFLLWATFGSINETKQWPGYCENGVTVCYMPDPSMIYVGMDAKYIGIPSTVTSVSKYPLSADEIVSRYNSEYTIYMLTVGVWNYEVIVDTPGAPDGFGKVDFYGKAIKPISLLSGYGEDENTK